MKHIITVFVTLFAISMQSSVFAGPDDRQDRRHVRQDSEVREERGRSDERQDKRECRQEEGAVGNDKRECKREEVRDGPRGNRSDD